MNGSKKDQDKQPVKGDDLAPDAWERFERAVDVVAKSKPRPKRKPADKPTSGNGKAKASPKKPPR